MRFDRESLISLNVFTHALMYFPYVIVYISAITVRFLTRRYIGEYDKTNGRSRISMLFITVCLFTIVDYHRLLLSRPTSILHSVICNDSAAFY